MLNELHQAVVAAAKALQVAQAVVDAEREENEIASKQSRMAEKEANKIYGTAMSAFLNEVENLEVKPANLVELINSIPKTRI